MLGGDPPDRCTEKISGCRSSSAGMPHGTCQRWVVLCVRSLMGTKKCLRNCGRDFLAGHDAGGSRTSVRGNKIRSTKCSI